MQSKLDLEENHDFQGTTQHHQSLKAMALVKELASAYSAGPLFDSSFWQEYSLHAEI